MGLREPEEAIGSGIGVTNTGKVNGASIRPAFRQSVLYTDVSADPFSEMTYARQMVARGNGRRMRFELPTMISAFCFGMHRPPCWMPRADRGWGLVSS